VGQRLHHDCAEVWGWKVTARMCLPLVIVALAPVLHCMDIGGARGEEHGAGSRSTGPRDSVCIRIVPRFGTGRTQRGWTAAARGSRITVPRGGICIISSPVYSRWRRSLTTWSAAARGARSTVPRDSVRIRIAPWPGPEGHSAEVPPTGHSRAGAVLALHVQRRRADRGAQCRGTAYASSAGQRQAGSRERYPCAGDFAGVTAPTDYHTRAKHGAQPEVGSPSCDPGAEAVPFGRRRNLRASAGAADVVRAPLRF